MTVEEIKAQYAHSVEYYSTHVKRGVNCYTCPSCKHITKTIDVDAGVTPFMHLCEQCKKELGQSSMYKDIAPNQQPTEEWYRPTLEEVLEMHKAGDYNMVSHIVRGGLHQRKISHPTESNQDA